MVEILERLKKQTQLEKNKTEILKNPNTIIGCTVSDSYRVLYFTESPEEPLYIDFIRQSFTHETLYVIPSGHVLYLPKVVCDFYCISISSSQISKEEKAWFYQQKYKLEKVVKVDVNLTDYIQNPSRNFITGLFDHNYLERPYVPSARYINLADMLSNILSQTEITAELAVSDLMQWVHTSEKTLNRFCQAVFQQNPKYIIQYLLLLKIVYRIVRNKQDLFKEISLDLGFKDASSFGRYVKSVSGFTPKEIRDNYSYALV